MKKFIIPILLLFSCSDQELIKSGPKSGLDNFNASPMNCEPAPEYKAYAMTGAGSTSPLQYGATLTINWQSYDLLCQACTVDDYVLTIVVKNIGAKPFKYYKNGVYVTTLSVGQTKTYTWSGLCDYCLGGCPDQVNGSFYMSVQNANGQNSSCEADMSVTLYADTPNSPILSSPQIFNYHWINPSC